MLQENLDKELKELDKKLEQKEVHAIKRVGSQISVNPSSIPILTSLQYDIKDFNIIHDPYTVGLT